jgi:hypothetical protein
MRKPNTNYVYLFRDAKHHAITNVIGISREKPKWDAVAECFDAVKAVYLRPEEMRLVFGSALVPPGTWTRLNIEVSEI